MMLTEQTGVPTLALPVQEFKDHLRLGTGFGQAGDRHEVSADLCRGVLQGVERGDDRQSGVSLATPCAVATHRSRSAGAQG